MLIIIKKNNNPSLREFSPAFTNAKKSKTAINKILLPWDSNESLLTVGLLHR
jgi:hypothetical protein